MGDTVGISGWLLSYGILGRLQLMEKKVQ